MCAGRRHRPSRRATLSRQTGNSSDEDASHCETLGTDDSSDASYTDGDSSSIDSDVGGASDEDSDASWLPSD